MKFHGVIAYFLFTLQMAIFAGCGSDSTTNVPVTTLAASQTCISCHSGANSSAPSTSSVTGRLFIADWMMSAHNTASAANKSGSGAGCPDCHGPAHNHPNDYCGQCHGGAAGPTLTWQNPDTAGQCWNCHRTGLPKKSPAHFYNITGAGNHPAMYVTPGRQNACSCCHDPHFTAPTQQMSDWAGSAHGTVTAAAWATEDFKKVLSGGSYQCVRCHTATGFKNFLAGSWANAFPTTTWATAADGNGREVLTCDACHASYDFNNSVRRTPAFTAPYNNGLSPAAFPDVGASNLCIACHSGRESGNSVNAISDFTNVSLPSPHHLPAAGLMYMTTGFTGFTSASAVIGTTTYGLTLTPDNVSTPAGIANGVTSNHRMLGFLDENGPCVTCHMNATGQPDRITSHTWQIDGNAFDQLCTHCHHTENTVPLTRDNFKDVFVKPQSDAFQTSLTLLENTLLAKWNIQFKDGSFYDLTKDPTGKTTVKDWTRRQAGANAPAGVALPLTTAQAKKLMGACFNITLLYNDPAAFAHAQSFSRRLVYDSIDFLDDGRLNLSVGATAIASNPATYGKGASAYTNATLQTLSPGTTLAMIYIINWNRTTGAWVSPERP